MPHVGVVWHVYTCSETTIQSVSNKNQTNTTHMSVSTIKQALALGAGGRPLAVTGVARLIWIQTKGVSQKTNKPWIKQAGVIDDGEANTVFTVWGHDDFSSLKGQQIVLAGHKAGNGRVSGLSVVAGPKGLQLELEDTGVVHTPESWAADNPGEGLPSPVAPVAPTPAPVNAPAPLPGSIRDTAPTPSPAAKSQPTFVRPTLDDLVALFGACFRAAKVVMWSGDVPPEGASLQATQAGAATLYISAVNNGLAVGAARRDPTLVPGGGPL